MRQLRLLRLSIPTIDCLNSLIVSRTFFVLTVLTVLTVSPQKRSIWSIWSCTFFITPCKHKNLHWHKWRKWHKLSFNTLFSAISATSAISFFYLCDPFALTLVLYGAPANFNLWGERRQWSHLPFSGAVWLLRSICRTRPLVVLSHS